MSNKWTDEQLEAAIVAYLSMLYDYEKGETPSKTEYYRNLTAKFGRNLGAWEGRMQNISFVFSLAGRSIVPGLKPRPNVGAKVLAKIEEILAKLEKRPLDPSIAFEAQVRKLMAKLKAKPMSKPPKGKKKPEGKTVARREIERDPAVKAWVLQRAEGKCENCGSDAPFVTDDGIPFLEVHHLIRLADGGPDTVENAVALCPNCHREFHYGVGREEMVLSIQTQIARPK